MLGLGSKARLALAGSTMALALASAPARADQVINSGFETGDTTGWLTSGGTWTSGAWPPPPSEYAGPPTLVSIMRAGGVDAITGAPVVFEGNYALRLNNQIGGNDISALSQTVANYTGNKLYYAWNAVLEPSHGATDSPSFIIKVVDKTTGRVVTNIAYSAYTAQNTTLFRAVNNFVTTDWKVEDIDVTNGHDYELTFVAVDCFYGGHGGYVYVDGFGNAIPVPNANVRFDPARDLTQGAKFLLPINGVTDIGLDQPFYTTADLAAKIINPNFIGGILRLSAAGTIADDFTVQSEGGTIDTAGLDADFGGTFTGPGGLAKAGLGTLTLSGLNTLNGRVAVNAGTLLVGNAFSALAFDVASGATLGGTGTLVGDVNVASGGTLAPAGSAAGTLKVAGGAVTMAAGSTLAIDIDGRTHAAAGGPGTYDRLAMSGGTTRFVAGGTITPNLRGITGGNNNFTPALGDTFTVVTSDAVTGSFVKVAQPVSGLGTNQRFDVRYGAKTVGLVVTPASFATLGGASGWKRNAVSAAAGIDAVRPAAGVRTSTLQTLFDGLYGMNAGQYGFAFQQLGGEIHAHALQMANNSVHSVNRIITDAASAPFGADDCAPATVDRKPADGAARPERRDSSCRAGGPTVWGGYLGDWTRAGEDSTAYRYRSNLDGVIAGINVIDGPAARLGFGGRYAESRIHTGIGSSAETEGGSLFAYGAMDAGPVTVAGTVGWHTQSLDTRRDLTLLTGTSTLTADYRIESLSAGLEARANVAAGPNVLLRPTAGIDWARNRAGVVKEFNADPALALTLPARTWTSAQTKLGAEARIAVTPSVEFLANGAWRHELANDPTALRQVQLGGASWTVATVGARRDSYEFGGGLGVSLARNVRVEATYNGTRDGTYESDRAVARLSIRF